MHITKINGQKSNNGSKCAYTHIINKELIRRYTKHGSINF